MKLQTPTVADFTNSNHNHSNTVGGGTIANITGNAATITLANDVANATDYLTFANTATGSQAIKTNAGVTVNPSTATITATTFAGALSGNATTATTATNATNVATTTKADNVNYFLPFVAANSSSNQAIDVGPMTANPSTSTITATNFAGNATTATSATSATSATTATNANNVNLANDTASATDYLVFSNTATGNQPLKTNTGVSVNPSTATITATTFSGALSGNATTATNASGLTGTPSITVATVTTTGDIELGNASDTTIHRVSGGVVSIEGSNIMTVGSNDTVTGTKTFSEADLADAGKTLWTIPGTNSTATGLITNAFNSGYSSTAIGDLVYLDSSSTWQKCDNTTSATTYGSGPIGIALEVKASGNACKVLLQGFVYSTSFPTLTIGAPVYMSTAAAVVVAQPSAANAAIRVVGYGIHANKMYFNPSNDYIVHT